MLSALFGLEQRAERGVAVRAQRQDARPIRRLGPVDGAARLVHPLVNHGIKTETGGDLAHLVMESAGVDHPHKARDEFPSPAPASAGPPPLLQQGFAARQIDGHLQEIGVDQLHPAFLRPLLDLLDPLRLEVHNGDHIIDFRKSELVIGIVADSIQMVQISRSRNKRVPWKNSSATRNWRDGSWAQ